MRGALAWWGRGAAIALAVVAAGVVRGHETGEVHTHDGEKAATNRAPAGDLGAWSTESLIKEVTAALDEGRPAEPWVSALEDRGMGVALAVVGELDEKHDTKSNELLHVMAHVGRSRRTQPELLKLYDPAAWRVFYGPESETLQKKLGVVLAWENWPHFAVIALVRVAPRPTLAWLQLQARSKEPNLAHVREILKEWGWWVRTGYEHQHHAELEEVIGSLGRREVVRADAETIAGVVRALGDCRAAKQVDVVVAAMEHKNETVREAAVIAAARLAPAADLTATGRLVAGMLRLYNDEKSEKVLVALAETAEAFGDNGLVGRNAAALFGRTTSVAVKRALAFAAQDAMWKERDTLVLAAIDGDDSGTAAAGLQALTARPVDAAAARVVELLDAAKSPQAVLIDAVGAMAGYAKVAGNRRVAEVLAGWLKDENPVIRLKVDLALEKLASAEGGRGRAAALLFEQLKGETSLLVMPQLVAIVTRLKLAEAEPTLISLATDTSAPLAVRTQAVWALGKFNTPAVKKTLEELKANVGKYFTDPKDVTLAAGSPERLEQARLFVATSRMQLGVAGAKEEADAVYRAGTPTTQVTFLMLLTDLKLDHPAIARGLESTEFAILLASIKAAGAADPVKYHARLEALAREKFVDALANSGLDTLKFKEVLEGAIAAGKEKRP